MTKQEIKELKQEKKFWKRYEQPFGWRLSGWTFKSHATFIRKDGSHVYVGDSGSIRPAELDLILKERKPR